MFIYQCGFFFANEVNCVCSLVFLVFFPRPHLIIFSLRWRPAVYHFCPLFTSQCLDNKLRFSPPLPLTSTRDKGTFKILQFGASAWALCHTGTFVIITVQRGRRRSGWRAWGGGGAPTLFTDSRKRSQSRCGRVALRIMPPQKNK